MISTASWIPAAAAAALCVWSCPSTSLCASELVQRDLTFTIGTAPTSFSYNLNDANGSHSGNDAFSQNIAVAVGGRYSFSGPGDSTGIVIGGALVADQASYKSLGHYTGYGLQVSGGYGWAITDHWSLGGRVLAGYGYATFDLQSNSAFPAVSSTGSTVSYGASADLDYTITDKITVLVDVGYQRTKASLSGSGTDLTLTTSGFMAALGIAWRFSSSPRPLE